MKKFQIVSVGIAVAVILAACNNGNNSNPISSYGNITAGYSVFGDTIKLNIPAGTEVYCNGDSLVSSSADSISFIFSNLGNTFKIYGAPDTNNYNMYQDPSLIIQFYDVFTRIGSGTGLTGWWDPTGSGYTVFRGTLTAAEKASLDSQSTTSPFNGFRFQVTVTSINISSALSPAASFVKDWNTTYSGFVDSAQYDIIVTFINDYSVRLQGKKSGKIVTLTWASNGDETYSSNLTSDTTITVYSKPTQCPNNTPNWYYTFLNNNIKTGIAKLSVANKQSQSKYSPNQKLADFFKKLSSYSTSR